jgi:hypothetical protein
MIRDSCKVASQFQGQHTVMAARCLQTIQVLCLLGYSLVVVVVTYPHPYETILIFYRKGAMAKTDPCGPEISHFL